MTRCIVLLAILLAGCDVKQTWTPDQCLRAELFASCMASLPAGPAQTRYNDLAEVVEACDGTAYRMSIRSPDQVSEKCK